MVIRKQIIIVMTFTNSEITKINLAEVEFTIIAAFERVTQVKKVTMV